MGLTLTTPETASALDRAAVNRGAGDDGAQHAGKLDVQSELGLAVDFALAFDALDVGADELEVFRIFERNVVGHGQRRGFGGELTVRGAPIAAHDVAVLGGERGLVDAPLLGRGFDEQRPRRGAGGTKTLPRRHDAGAASRDLHVKHGIGVLGRRGRWLDTDGLPVGVELFGNDHRKRRVDALSHLGLVDDDGHDVVRADAHERVRRERPRCVDVAALGPARGDIETEHEARRGRAGGFDKGASRVSLFHHGHTPAPVPSVSPRMSAAAFLIAHRMRP